MSFQSFGAYEWISVGFIVVGILTLIVYQFKKRNRKDDFDRLDDWDSDI